MDRERAASRRPALDGLRAIAALGVVAHHTWQYSGKPVAPLGIWWRELSLGVALFFCLSGFLVFAPWSRAGRSEDVAPPSVGRFYALRAARIIPLYYVSLLAAVLLLAGTGHWRFVDDWRLLGFAVFAQNYFPSMAGMLNPPTWTLAIEVTFYLLVPLIGLAAMRAGRRGGRPGQLAVLLLLTVGSVVWAATSTPGPVVQQTLPDVVGLFCVGMAARVLVDGRRIGPLAGRPLLVGGVGLVWAHATGRLGTPLGGALRDLPAGVGFALICVACAQPSAPRLLACRPLAYLGTLSYGIYLWHYPILLGLQAHGLLPVDNVAETLLLVGGGAILAAALTWKLLEQPVLELTRRRLDARAARRGYGVAGPRIAFNGTPPQKRLSSESPRLSPTM